MAQFEDDETIIGIRNLSLLPSGWDYGQGDTPNGAVIEKAIEIYCVGRLVGFKAEAMPMTDGGIELSFYKNPSVLFRMVEIQPDCKLEFRMEKGLGTTFHEVPLPK